MKFKKGDLAQRIGGFETPHYNYRGEQIYIITDVKDEWFEGYVYLCLDHTWVKTTFFEWDVTPLDYKLLKKFFKPAIISLFNEDFI